jgi:cytochrome c oxidase cbb3-type subunit 4
MDINLLRSLVTVAAFAAFVGIMWWAYAPLRKARFERDALLPFDESELPSVVELPCSAQPSPPPLSHSVGEGRFAVQTGCRPARNLNGERK